MAVPDREHAFCVPAGPAQSGFPMVATPTVVLTSPRPPVEESGACAVCPHPLDGHDRISLRFCQATQAAAATRGCVCPSS
jgi:hypothetical protein